MNYEKKRKRQNGRQMLLEPKYKIYVDEFGKIHAEIDKPGKKISTHAKHFSHSLR